MKMYKILALCLIAAMPDLVAQHVPSKERVDPNLRRRTEIDGNNVRTSVFNFCFSGRTGGGQGVPYEWPKNTNRYYVALVGLFIGGEVTMDDGTTVQRIVDLPAYRNSPGDASWNMEPIPGYFNAEYGKIAKSDEPQSWPAEWPDKKNDSNDPGWKGKWNGFFGKNQFSADQEMYYRTGDNNYNRYSGAPSQSYTPDTTDATRKGLGMIIDSRVMEWSQASVADAVFFIHEVKNDGTKPIKKTAVTLWLADFVGGDGDSQDDSPSFDLLLDVAFSLDANGTSSNPAFQGAFVGAAATLYLETPGNATDRIDNDGDGETDGPKVLGDMLAGEITANGIDDNKNGLIDEDSTYVPFGAQVGVSFADGIDNNNNSETGGPVVTAQMVTQSSGDLWKRWPADPDNDAVQAGVIHLIGLETDDVGKRYRDNIDNDGDAVGGPLVTQAMIDAAASDPFKRYKVPGTKIILFDLGAEDLGKKYLAVEGLSDVGIDEGIDEMIDESRNDGIDNDNDWEPLKDDVGLDGAPGTGDPGEGDGKPTSGYGTSFPGEPNIDKTDVSEADQIGLTNVQYLKAGAIDFNKTTDAFFWGNFMVPGSFVDPSILPTGDYDLFVSSGLFPMQPGQIERISYAVVLGAATQAGNANVSGAKADALRKREFAQLAYNEDYQFAQAPIEPTLSAIAGNRKVTLYWDDVAEKSVDRFLAGVAGATSKDFEGYRIYRSTDPAFQDAKIITDAYGSPAPFARPIAQFDLKDGIEGFHPIAFNGVQFNLGTETGIVHSWTDTTVQNGQKYYYAIRAYDQGYAPLNITPAESNLRISIDNVTGSVKSIGTSVVIVTPEAPVAGYTPPKVSNIQLIQGSTTGKVGYTIVDPTLIKNNHKYRITFGDTVISGGQTAPDTFKTLHYNLTDVTNSSVPVTLINKNSNLADGTEHPLIDGFRLSIQNEKTFGINSKLSGWSRNNIYRYIFAQWSSGFTKGLQKPSDYKIIFGSGIEDTSLAFVIGTNGSGQPTTTTTAIPTYFKIINTSENKQIDFAFQEFDTVGGPGHFSVGASDPDYITFLEKDLKDSLVTTWGVYAAYDTSSLLTNPKGGDTLTLVLSKIFRSSDIFEFTTTAQNVDKAAAKANLDKIRVVPNPYVAAATWEPRNPYNSGRGPRSIHFNNLPQKCTIRIYTISGELVTKIEHNSPLLNGSAEWNLLSKDNLAVSYGVYIYHIDAPDIGEKIGKFAIIK